MPTDSKQKRLEAQRRIARLLIDIERTDTDSVTVCGHGVLTTEDLEALLYLIRPGPDCPLYPEDKSEWPQ